MSLHTFIRLFMPACLLQSTTYGLTFMLPELFVSIGGTTADVGSVLGVTALITIGVVIMLGKIAMAIGAMPLLASSGMICSASLFLFATATAIDATVYLAGALLGLGWALFYVLGPIILAQVVTPDRRVAQFTWLSAFVMVGIGSGPIIGAALGAVTAFHLVALSCLLSTAVFGILTPQFACLRIVRKEVESTLSIQSALQVMRSIAWRPVVMVGWVHRFSRRSPISRPYTLRPSD